MKKKNQRTYKSVPEICPWCIDGKIVDSRCMGCLRDFRRVLGVKKGHDNLDVTSGDAQRAYRNK